MPFAIKATLKAIESHLAKSGYDQKVQIGEYKAPPPGQAFAAAIYIRSTRVLRLFANGGTQELHVAAIRLYRDMLQEPQEDGETVLAVAAEQMMQNIAQDADLGATIMTVDVGGISGTPMGSDWGYADIGGKMFRIVDITVPLLVNDSMTVAP